jgi:hypothetical protein
VSCAGSDEHARFELVYGRSPCSPRWEIHLHGSGEHRGSENNTHLCLLSFLLHGCTAVASTSRESCPCFMTHGLEPEAEGEILGGDSISSTQNGSLTRGSSICSRACSSDLSQEGEGQKRKFSSESPFFPTFFGVLSLLWQAYWPSKEGLLDSAVTLSCRILLEEVILGGKKIFHD